ncbi:hypothetical protein ACE41H_22480 [Paenibacillus enshidis]|uniref:Uncharacterized protein n=1 Tax=Paenibacillus enshidis TaxID=1458439 RepID=A0ABV5B1J2_9BACL
MEMNNMKEEAEKNEQNMASQEENKSLLEEFGVLSHVEYGY